MTCSNLFLSGTSVGLAFAKVCLLSLTACGSLNCLGETVRVANQSELDAAITRVVSGDTIVMRNGVWTDTSIRLSRSGTEKAPITLRAETGGEVILTGASSLDFAADWLVVEGLRFEKLNSPRVFVVFEDDADHCLLTSTAILDSNNGSKNWVHMRKGISNRIERCYFSGMDQPGMQIQVETEPTRPSGHRINHNFFGHRARGNGNGFETIRIGYSFQQTNLSSVTVEGNVFYKCDGENEIISNKSTGNRILNNTFMANRGELTLRHGDKAWVEGNWFLGQGVPGSGGVRVIGSDHVVVNNYFSNLRTYAILLRNGVATTDPKSYTQVKNALVTFNTVVNCSRSLVVATGRGELIPADCTIANNLFYNPSGQLIHYGTAPTNFVYEGNIAFGDSLGIPNPGGLNEQDPKVIQEEGASRAGQGIYRAAPEGPARNGAAGDYPQVKSDISGNSRSGSNDAGAQVLSPGAKQSYPLTEADVGPDWMRGP